MIGSQSFSYKEMPLRIIWSVAFLSLVGLVVLNSISQQYQGGFFTPFTKQFLFLFPAVLIAFIIIFIPRYTIHKYSYTLYVLGIIFVLLPYTGNPHAGTYRWFDLGLPFAIQPSEFVKVFTTLALARYLSDHTLQMRQFSSIIIPIGLTLVPTLIVMNQPDLGTAIVMMTPILPMLYWSGARPFYLFLVLAPIFSMVTAFHTTVFTLWALVLGVVILTARPKLVLSLFLFF